MEENAQSGITSKIERPLGPSEIERVVKTRRLQTFFRHVVLTSYENCSALTGINFPELLVASHIIPCSKNENRRADQQTDFTKGSL